MTYKYGTHLQAETVLVVTDLPSVLQVATMALYDMLLVPVRTSQPAGNRAPQSTSTVKVLGQDLGQLFRTQKVSSSDRSLSATALTRHVERTQTCA